MDEAITGYRTTSQSIIPSRVYDTAVNCWRAVEDVSRPHMFIYGSNLLNLRHSATREYMDRGEWTEWADGRREIREIEESVRHSAYRALSRRLEDPRDKGKVRGRRITGRKAISSLPFALSLSSVCPSTTLSYQPTLSSLVLDTVAWISPAAIST